MSSFRTINKGWCKMFFIGLESGQYDADDIMWSRVSDSEYHALARRYARCKNSLRISVSDGLHVIAYALFSLSVVSGLISAALWVARDDAISSLSAMIMLAVAALLTWAIDKLPLFAKAHRQLVNARNMLDGVSMRVPSDVIDAAARHCHAHQTGEILDMLEANDLDVDSIRDGKDEPSPMWLTLNWLQAYPLLFYHLLIDLQEEIYRTNFLYIDVDEKVEKI